MKTLKTITQLVLTILMFSCSKDESSPPLTNAEQLMGSWELTSGNFQGNETKYITFNGDNIKILLQDEQGFRKRFDYNAIENITETEFTYNTQGPILYTYTISENTLTVSENTFNSTATFTKHDNAPLFDEWIITLTREVETPTPWTNATDITYLNDYILGYDESTSVISSIHVNTFLNGGGIMFSTRAFALTYNYNGDLLVHSNANDKKLYTSELDGISNGSVQLNLPLNYMDYNNSKVWISSTTSKMVMEFNYNTAMVEQELPLSKQPRGIVYSNGFLYISTFDYLHKCQINNTQIRAIETYHIANVGGIYGLTSDGTNLWINTQRSGLDDKLIKTNLTF